MFVCVPRITSAEGTIIVVGDSLSSGYGLQNESSWVQILQDRLNAEDYGYELINASVPGDTSSGGLARLPRLLEAHSPVMVIIELGGNDGLRGQPVQQLRENLREMIRLVQAVGALPIILGIQIPPNYGSVYTSNFAAIYPQLSTEFNVPLVEFLMQGVALNPGLMQADGIHPNEKGNEIMMDNVWMVLEGLL
ncbi:MAG: arylesterase [Rhodospirillaceae bacterium]|nr:arylesterase [Rhodospirillaceae bacterium]